MSTMAKINERFSRLEKEICDAYDRDGLTETTMNTNRMARAEMKGYLEAMLDAGLIYEITVKRTLETFDTIMKYLIKEEGGKNDGK